MAGGHPDLVIQFTDLNRMAQKSQSPCNCEDPKDTLVHLPAGFVGNPHATPQCSMADFSADECPIDSQIGVVEIEAGSGASRFDSMIYNVIPPPDVAGLIAFKIPASDAPQFAVLSSRTGGDYGLDAKAFSIFHGLGLPLSSFREELWGVPADPSHDGLRLDPSSMVSGGKLTSFNGSICNADGSLSTADPNTWVTFCGTSSAIPPAASSSPLVPFLQNPTTCDIPLSSSLELTSYDGGSDERELPWPQMTGCDQLGFNPSLYAQPTSTQSDSPAGIDINLTVPQPLSPYIPSPTELRGATVTLPPGLAINPSAADGKVACSDAEARFGTPEEGHCPEYSKVGSLTIDSSALPGPLHGFVYLGAPLPGDKHRIFLLADGFATHIKLAGTITPDPVTGQLSVSFRNLPQSPLTAFNMHFFGSERGVLATPTQCSTYPVSSTFTPWDSSLPTVTSTQYFTIESGPEGQPCPSPTRTFSPTFESGSSSHAPGTYAPFSLEVRRQDGDQNLGGLRVRTPPGLAATLKGVSYCPQAAIEELSNPAYSGLAELASPLCPPSSQIGTAIGGAGAGNHPVYMPGKVYLAGPYKGAPLSLLVVVPAISGPYDFGNVAVRAAIQVDPVTAQATAVSDPIPQTVEGIPLRTRSIRISLDRPDFTINPTNCKGLAVEAQITGSEGAIVTPTAHFQVANCASLPFEPKLQLQLSGGIRRATDPAVHAVFTAQPGEANVARLVVVLPHSEFLDDAHVGRPCAIPLFEAESCPAESLLGHATVETPLLEKPLEGPVLVRTSTHRLPDLVIALHGQIRIHLVARIDSIAGRLRASFNSLPDVPVSRVSLNLAGGSRGLLENSEDLCLGLHRALVRLLGQNGRLRTLSIPVNPECPARARPR